MEKWKNLNSEERFVGTGGLKREPEMKPILNYLIILELKKKPYLINLDLLIPEPIRFHIYIMP
jgi:hypothetical protein